MFETSFSLLDRLCTRSDETAWQRFVELYSPFIRQWLRSWTLQPADADDLAQEILAVVVRKVPAFRHDGRAGSFRSWLRAITVNILRDFWRARGSHAMGGGDFLGWLEQLEDPNTDLARRWDEEHDRHVLSGLLQRIEPEFQPITWQAFRRHVLEGRSPKEVAEELGKSVNAVLIAKSRVLQRLREEAGGVLDQRADQQPDE